MYFNFVFTAIKKSNGLNGTKAWTNSVPIPWYFSKTKGLFDYSSNENHWGSATVEWSSILYTGKTFPQGTFFEFISSTFLRGLPPGLVVKLRNFNILNGLKEHVSFRLFLMHAYCSLLTLVLFSIFPIAQK